MLKSLVASCLCALSVNTQPLTPSRAITEDINGKYEITYKYESNEVNSINDIYSGNVYYLSCNGYRIDDFVQGYFLFELISPLEIDSKSLVPDETISFSTFAPHTFLCFSVDTELDLIFIQTYYTYEQYLYGDYSQAYLYSADLLSDCLVVVYEFDYISYSFFSYTDYNEIVSIREIRSHNNLYRLLYDFYYSIFSDEDLAEISTGYNMPFDNWLAHTCTIITLLVLVFVCFLFLKWLFKVISGLILLKH